MLHKIEATGARKEDNKGNPIPKAKLKYRTMKFTVCTKDSTQILNKAGQRITAEGFVVGDIKVIK